MSSQHPCLADAEDTIVAVSTAAGASPRAIVRMSGPSAPDLLMRMTAGQAKDRLPRRNYRSFSTDVVLPGFVLPARIYVMRAPSSYTREDIVEIHTFGSPPLLAALMEELTRLGARPAGPGEFTRRAFLNGRLDLAQAEAVEALVRARSDAEYRAALGAMEGALSRRIRAVRQLLADLAAEVETSLDFSDHDVEIISREQVVARLRSIDEELKQILAAGEDGRIAQHRPKAALLGPPNAGKSSLFNAVLQRRRAIVSPHPGTTRDTIEAVVSLNGLELVLVDTAGLRSALEEVEAAAVARSRESARRADLILYVLDSAAAPDPQTLQALQELDPVRSFLLLNKCDLGPPHPELAAAMPRDVEPLSVSAITGQGMPTLLTRMRESLENGRIDRPASELMVNARQAGHLAEAAAAIERILAQHQPSSAMDLVAGDIVEALRALSEITGDAVAEDILDRIFSRFCIGK